MQVAEGHRAIQQFQKRAKHDVTTHNKVTEPSGHHGMPHTCVQVQNLCGKKVNAPACDSPLLGSILCISRPPVDGRTLCPRVAALPVACALKNVC